MAKIDSVICNICNCLVLTDSIFCDLCNTWLHISCLKLNKKSTTILSKSEDKWYCTPCIKLILPFSNVANLCIYSLMYNSTLPDTNNSSNCFHCQQNIKNKSNSIFCTIGKHYLHLKCPSLTRKQKININTKPWSCLSCNPFPFFELTNNDFKLINIPDPVTDNLKSQHVNINTNFAHFSNLPKLTINNPILEQNHQEKIINFKYYNPKKFKKMSTNFQHKSFSIFHTNIRSYEKKLNLCQLYYMI